jgi:succinate dehydrogenase / fumarate reductase flavoprotein subunit
MPTSGHWGRPRSPGPRFPILTLDVQCVVAVPAEHGALLDGRGMGRPEDHGTGVEGLYAIGEASSGLHGANRLGGNSLIELLVYGRIVGRAAARYSSRLNVQQRCHAAVSAAGDEIGEILSGTGPENVRFLQRALRNAMTEHAGVVGDEVGLLEGLGKPFPISPRTSRRGCVK